MGNIPEAQKFQYDKHYFVEHASFVTQDGVPSYRLEDIVLRCQEVRNLLDFSSVLDCGCSTGWVIRGFQEIAPSIIVRGIDISEFAIGSSEASVRDKLILCDISGTLPFEDREFDLVIAFDVLEHVHTYSKLVNAVRGMCRVANKFILLRQPMSYWTGVCEEFHPWIQTLNSLPHKARLTLVDTELRLHSIYPDPFSGEHPNVHPREFWIELFGYFGFLEKTMPEEAYHFPNANLFCSYNLLVFERKIE